MSTRQKSLPILGVVLLLAVVGCTTVHDINRVTPEDVSREGTIVFVRPSHYELFGTRSFSDYTEITHEKAARNEAGLLEVQVGLRNRGGRHWWDLSGPNFSLSVKTAFYDQPFDTHGGQTSIPVYETNWQPISLPRGDTYEYKAVCPKQSAGYYQVTVSEILK